MQIEHRPTDSIKPYDKNPRHNDSAVDAVAKSLQEFGWRQPVVVDKDGVIVVGHTRWKAAQKLGMQTVPVHVATELTPAQARAYRIADNATGGIATWDMDLLPVEIKELEALDFDLDFLGFTDEQMADMMAGPDGETEEDDAPAVQKQAVSRRGDIWLLGGHRLLNGDSTDPADVLRVMNGEKAALCATDPPRCGRRLVVRVRPITVKENWAPRRAVQRWVAIYLRERGSPMARMVRRRFAASRTLSTPARYAARARDLQQPAALSGTWFGPVQIYFGRGCGDQFEGGVEGARSPWRAGANCRPTSWTDDKCERVGAGDLHN
jgi:hypothetical protein